MTAGFTKAGLAVGAVLVVLLAGAVTGSALIATGAEPRVSQPRATGEGPPAESNPAAREFVSQKKTWTACVKEAAPDRESAARRFDPEQACGTKPHPHDVAGKHADKPKPKPGTAKHEGPGPPAWAGGPDRRTAEPPGHARRD